MYLNILSKFHNIYKSVILRELMKKLIGLLFLLVLISGCTTSSSPIKKLMDNPDKYLGKEVVVDGQINERFIKLGDPYFSLVDKEGYVLVQSKFDLGKNSNVTVKGIFSNEDGIGYFIKSREVKVK